MHRFLLVVTVSGVLSTATPTQTPRAPQRIDAASALSFDPVIATDSDRTLLAWVEASAVYVARADGRGKSWSAPVRVDADTSGAAKDIEEGDLRVVGNAAYLLWKDERHGATHEELYFSSSADGGATWAAEQRIDKAAPVGFGTVRDWRLGASAGSPGQVYVMLTVDPTLFANEVLILVRSLDGGATFLPAAVVPQSVLAGAFDVDNGDLAVDGSTLYISWTDNRTGEDDVYLQKSTDGGATWLSADVRIDSSVGGNAEGVAEVAVSGSTVAVVWLEERPNNAPDSLRANVSTDGAATFNGDRLVGNYTLNLVDVDNPHVAVNPDGDVLVAWDDNRLGIDEVFVASSNDGGLSWRTDVQLSSQSGEFPRVIAGPGGTAAVLWTGGVFPETGRAALSMDGGASWLPSFAVSANTGDVDSIEAAYNTLYDNFVVAYLSDDVGANNLFAGGFRPQTVDAVGWGTAAATVRFDLARMGSATLALVAASTGTGPLAIPGDPRLLCLAPDPLLLATAGSPAFQASLSNGAGSTPSIPNVFAGQPPLGLTVHFAAIGIGGGQFTIFTDAGSFQL